MVRTLDSIRRWCCLGEALSGAALLLLLSSLGCAPSGQHIQIHHGGQTVTEHDFDQQRTVLFNQSVETLALDALEKTTMSRLGLDPNRAEDYALLAFISRGFHLRFQACQRSDTPRRELGVYLYNLDGVRSGQPIPVLDASLLEEASPETLGATLHRLFDPIRHSGEPRALVAVAPDRSGEDIWRRVFITAFAKNVYFANTGTAVITDLKGRDGQAISRLQIPGADLQSLRLALKAQRQGNHWSILPKPLTVTVSGP